jgi:hypothetical protein
MYAQNLRDQLQHVSNSSPSLGSFFELFNMLLNDEKVIELFNELKRFIAALFLLLAGLI